MPNLIPVTTEASSVGARYYQEDRYLTLALEQGFFVGVFDGHGGEEVSELISTELPKIITAQLALDHTPESFLLNVVANLDLLTADKECGSTLSLVYFPIDVSEVWLAVMGDSPVLVKGANGEIVIGPEHNVRTNLVEREAAITRGAVYGGGYLWVATKRYGDNVAGLQMSRALGDVDLRSFLSRVPEIFSVPLNQESWVAVMSDGVVDPGHSSSSRMEMVIAMLERGCDASELVNQAMADKTGDNATAIVVRFPH
jgi:serine/threonine protein phosphatase PrpC